MRVTTPVYKSKSCTASPRQLPRLERPDLLFERQARTVKAEPNVHLISRLAAYPVPEPFRLACDLHRVRCRDRHVHAPTARPMAVVGAQPCPNAPPIQGQEFQERFCRDSVADACVGMRPQLAPAREDACPARAAPIDSKRLMKRSMPAALDKNANNSGKWLRPGATRLLK